MVFMKNKPLKNDRQTKPGTPSNATKKVPTPGSGRNKTAKGYDPEKKTWR